MSEQKLRINTRQHGTRTMYVTGCRCEPCKEADRAYHRDYYARRKDEPNSPWRRRLKGRFKRLDSWDGTARPATPSPKPPTEHRGSESGRTPEAELR